MTLKVKCSVLPKAPHICFLVNELNHIILSAGIHWSDGQISNEIRYSFHIWYVYDLAKKTRSGDITCFSFYQHHKRHLCSWSHKTRFSEYIIDWTIYYLDYADFLMQGEAPDVWPLWVDIPLWESYLILLCKEL